MRINKSYIFSIDSITVFGKHLKRKPNKVSILINRNRIIFISGYSVHIGKSYTIKSKRYTEINEGVFAHSHG